MNSVKWELTQRCNLQCKHCFVGKIEYEKDLGINEARKMIDVMVSSGIHEIVLSTKEPFAYSNICELLDYCAEQDLYLTIVTNGTLITERALKSIARSKIKSLSVSMEGITAESNDYIRGKGVYDKVISAISRINKLNESTKYAFPLVLQISLTSINYGEISKMIPWFEDSPFIAVNVGDIALLGNAVDNDNIKLTEEQYDIASEILLKQYSELENPSFNLNLKKSTPYDTLYNNMRYGLCMDCVIPSCASYHGYYSILPNGDTCSCVALNDVSFSHISNLKSGLNILRNGYIATESRIDNLGEYKKEGFCNECIYKDRCELCLLLVYDAEKLKQAVAKCKKAAAKIKKAIDKIVANELKMGINRHSFIYEHDGRVELKKVSPTGTSIGLDISDCVDIIKEIYQSLEYVLYEDVFVGDKEFNRSIIERLAYNDMLVIEREEV